MMRVAAHALLLLALGLGSALADVAVPPLSARVTDLTDTLNGDQRARLEQELQNFEARKGSQLAVLIVPTTQPETIEQYGIRVADSWKLGRKGIDDGALLLIAKGDRRLRIEVGYGLEGPLNDATAKRIVSDVITPYFRKGDFYGGIEAGLQSMMKVIEGEPLPAPSHSISSSFKSRNLGPALFIGLILVMIVGGILRALLGRFAAASLVGGLISLLAWLFIVPLTMALVIGAIGFLFTLFGGSRGWYGGWPGAYSSGGFGSGGFSGGGFSGGGGGFGGGGASGSW
ncbi:MAG TPA: YgcG family protein [Burkholderiales bacterium]|nr:YgcG family protein [Burkholderiales bacterium]